MSINCRTAYFNIFEEKNALGCFYCFHLAVFVLISKGIMVTQFVEGWDFVQTLGEGAYGEYVLFI